MFFGCNLQIRLLLLLFVRANHAKNYWHCTKHERVKIKNNKKKISKIIAYNKKTNLALMQLIKWGGSITSNPNLIDGLCKIIHIFFFFLTFLIWPPQFINFL